MNHKKQKKMIVPYLDNTLNTDQREELEGHLKHCSSCREALNTMQNFVSNIKEPAAEEMDREKFRQILMATRQAFFLRQENRARHMVSLPSIIAILSSILLFISSLYSMKLLTSGITPLGAVVALTLIGSQIAGILFLMLVFILKKRSANQINGFVSGPEKSY